MSKVAVSLGSFAAGACVMALLSAVHMSMIVQSSSALAEEPVHVWGNIYTDMPNAAVAVPGAVPVVPGLGAPMQDSQFVRVGRQPLDGLNCARCVFDGTTLTYGGGAYNIPAFTFSNIRVQFTGAAANTLRFLQLMESLRHVPAQPAPQPKQSIEVKIPTNKPITVQLVSLTK